MKNIVHKHKAFWFQKESLIQGLVGLLLLFVSLFVNYYANIYASISASNVATDIILDNLPVVDMSFIFIYGALAFLVVLASLLIYEPKYIPFVLKSISLFLVVRSFFMILTHLAPPVAGTPGYGIDGLSIVSSGDDLFFSAHTGLPFMLSLVYWNRGFWRWFFLASTFVGAISVLLGHLHYSIDVFAAFFIAFGIYRISLSIFKKDYELFA
ncbi:MAG: phosphatase PAP2-related protein [bacterium]